MAKRARISLIKVTCGHVFVFCKDTMLSVLVDEAKERGHISRKAFSRTDLFIADNYEIVDLTFHLFISIRYFFFRLRQISAWVALSFRHLFKIRSTEANSSGLARDRIGAPTKKLPRLRAMSSSTSLDRAASWIRVWRTHQTYTWILKLFYLGLPLTTHVRGTSPSIFRDLDVSQFLNSNFKVNINLAIARTKFSAIFRIHVIGKPRRAINLPKVAKKSGVERSLTAPKWMAVVEKQTKGHM